jgi:hypothetical protein
MKIDTKQLRVALDRMDKAAKEKGKVLSKDQGTFFLRMTQKLSWKVAPTKAYLDSLKDILGGRIKRKPGVSVDKEIARRKRARGTFARDWRLSRVEVIKNGFRIWIRNTISYAGVVNEQHQVASNAATIVGNSFGRKLRRYAGEVTKSFRK